MKDKIEDTDTAIKIMRGYADNGTDGMKAC